MTRYAGKELLELMGPVETAYCDMDGEQEVRCSIRYTLELPECSVLGDFDGVDLLLNGPCADDIDDNCLITDEGPPDLGATSVDFLIDICAISESCYATGNWALETRLIEDGERLPGCESRDYFDDQRTLPWASVLHSPRRLTPAGAFSALSDHH